MNKITALFKLVRWQNLLMIALMMILVYHSLMSPLHACGVIGALPSALSFLLLLISLIFIVAAGYVINDYFDVEIDKVNKPEQLIVSKIFSETETKIFYVLLTILGIIIGAISGVIALNSKFYIILAILALLTALLYSYSSSYKRKLVVGNIIVSFSVAFAVFLPWLFVMLYLSDNVLILSSVRDVIILSSMSKLVMIYTAFAFLMTLLREIVKDAEDLKGDKLTRCRTIPIVLGIKKMNVILILSILLICMLLIYFTYVLYVMHSYITLIIMSLILLCLALSLTYLPRKDISYHKYSVFLKIMMLLGIISMIFV